MAAIMGRLLPACSIHFSRGSKQIHVKRWKSITGNESADKALNTLTAGKIGGWLERYENIVGLTDVREAQGNVIQAESQFIEVQNKRRQQQQQATAVQGKIKELHAQLDKVQRGDERYLKLLTEEYEILKEEKLFEANLKVLEENERAKFASLSSAVRESHEKERTRTERTKYWSVIGSITGAVIGITGTSINNYLRMRELRGIVTESSADGVELKSIVTELSETTKNQHNQLQGFVTDLKGLVGVGSLKTLPMSEKVNDSIPQDITNDKLESKTKEILEKIQLQDKTMKQEMEDIKKLLASTSGLEGNVVYIGPNLEHMLDNTEKNLEWKIKMNSLWTVTFIYGALAVTIPILYTLFKGS